MFAEDGLLPVSSKRVSKSSKTFTSSARSTFTNDGCREWLYVEHPPFIEQPRACIAAGRSQELVTAH